MNVKKKKIKKVVRARMMHEVKEVYAVTLSVTI